VKIILNGFPENLDHETVNIRALLEALQEDDPAVIVEVNGRFVHRKEFSRTPIREGDVVEFIHPSFGG
jgi:thiamine biosynthesis protein ThiS